MTPSSVKFIVISTMFSIPALCGVLAWSENRPRPARVTLSEPDPEPTVQLPEQQVETGDSDPVLQLEDLPVARIGRTEVLRPRRIPQHCWVQPLQLASGGNVLGCEDVR